MPVDDNVDLILFHDTKVGFTRSDDSGGVAALNLPLIAVRRVYPEEGV